MSSRFQFKLYQRAFVFVGIYLFATALVIPFVAPFFGRVPLPIRADTLRPRTMWTCILNRHYVNPKLKAIVLTTADQLKATTPYQRLLYLDANFPFLDGFPMLPHWSHKDGKKLDLAFLYADKNGKAIATSPSWYGYGVSEAARATEMDQTAACEASGYWWYGLLNKITPQARKENFQFDEAAN